MSTPVLPTIIRGPAIITFNSMSYYFKEGVSVKPVKKTTEILTDFFGRIDSRLESIMVEIEGTPAGELRSAAKFYPYGPSNISAASAVGSSIFTASDLPLVLATKAGLTTTFSRGGIAKSPTLFLSPRKTAYGSMVFRAIGKRSTQQTTSTWLKAIASASFTDTTFDDSKVKTDIYSAALGSRSSPYNAMGARTGFELEPVYELDDAEDDGVGIADTFITSVAWKLRFAPNNLTEAQLDTLANWQDTDAIIPGQSLSRGPSGAKESLVITADALSATLNAVGIQQVENGFGVKVDRNGMVEWVTRQTFTTGAPDPLITLVFN
jgi:hypothetical protein